MTYSNCSMMIHNHCITTVPAWRRATLTVLSDATLKYHAADTRHDMQPHYGIQTHRLFDTYLS